MSQDVADTLKERGGNYGGYAVQASQCQAIKKVFAVSPNWSALPDAHRDALEMIAVKISRILCGDPAHVDSWHDIAGYASLVEDLLEGGAGLPNGCGN